MSINLSTFWTTWGVSSGDTSSTNQYDFWRGIIMDDNTQLSSQYDFFKYNNTTRYEFFNNLNSTYPEVWDEYTFYQNTNDPRIFDFDTFYTYAAQSLPGGGPTPPTFYSNSFNCSNPFNVGNICGCPTSNLTSAYAACEDYYIYGCPPTFYWIGANPTEPEIGDTMYSTESESDSLSGEGTFWISDGVYGYEVNNSGAVISKQICEPLRQINLLGAFSSWSGGYVLTTTDNVNYIYSGASLPGGDVKFRQDDSWAVNWGGSDWPSGIGYQDGPNIPSQEGNWLVTFNRLTGAYDFVPVLTATINPSFTVVNDNVILYATTSYPTGAVYTWQLTDFYETATDEPITSFTGDTLPEGYFTSSGSSNVTLTIVNGTQTAVSSSFQICPFAVSGSITPSSAYTNTNVILSGSSNYDGGYVDYTWYLTDFFDASTDEPITYYNGQVLPEGYFTTTGSSNVQLYISSCGNPAVVGIDVYQQIPLSGSIAPISAYTDTNIILTGSSNYTGSTFIWGLSNFRNTTGGTVTSYTGNPLVQGYFVSSGNSNVNLTILAGRQTATTSNFNVYTLPVVPMNASGGTITTITADTKVYKVHTFLSGGTFNVTSLGTTSGQVEYLIVGGGGGGGSTYANMGSGAAGGMLTGSTNLSVSGYTIFVGSGGTGGDQAGWPSQQNIVSGQTGGNSSFANNIAYGGGGGALNGGNGGSGAGAGGSTPAVPGTAGTGIAGQGNNGGNATNGAYGSRSSGGGGGAGAVGGNGGSNTAGSGGNGRQSAINGTLTYYAGGGAGGGLGIQNVGTGGLGGGGNTGYNVDGYPGTANTGGGGGAPIYISGADKNGGNGGSGIVIIRYEIF